MGLIALSVACVALLRFVPPPTTAFILRERLFHGSAAPNGFHREWMPLRDISPRVAIAVVAAEDQRFPTHHGFDLTEIRKALEEDGRRRGASTLSQQVAKNLFLWPGGWVRKGLEAYLTVLIEALWPKRRILEMYLNVAEFGPGVFGVQAASVRFFGKPASQLTRREAARLAAVLPSPKRMSVAKPSAYVLRRAWEIDREVTHLGGTAYLDPLW